MPANITTDETAILNGVVQELMLMDGANGNNVFIAARDVWLESPPGDWYIEVIPGAAQDKLAKQGRGWLRDSFQLAIFRRLLVDIEPQDTARIADATMGLLLLVRQAEQALTQNYLSGLALTPVLPDRREAAERNPQDPYDGWAMIRRTFNVEYLYDFGSPQSLDSA